MHLMEKSDPEVVKSDVKLSGDSSDFVLLSDVIPDAILEIRYYSTYNFIGDRVDGYEEPLAFLTKEAAFSLREVSDELVKKGYRLKIYDAYRPQKAVTNFVNWSMEEKDTRIRILLSRYRANRFRPSALPGWKRRRKSISAEPVRRRSKKRVF